MTANSDLKVAVVTGGNKGIGYAIIKDLITKFDGIIYLTARNESLGKRAVSELDNKGEKVKFHQLDVSDIESIKIFETFIKNKHNGIDLLINNAGIVESSNKPIKKQAIEVVKVNYFGVLNMNTLFPLLRNNARVVNVSSDWGCIHYIDNEHFKNKLIKRENTIDEISSIMNEFIDVVEKSNYQVGMYEGYKMSKNGLNALTREQQKLVDINEKNILISAVHPGEVITDMNPGGNISAEKSIETIIYLALQPAQCNLLKGAYWYEKKAYEWDNPDLNLSIFH